MLFDMNHAVRPEEIEAYPTYSQFTPLAPHLRDMILTTSCSHRMASPQKLKSFLDSLKTRIINILIARNQIRA